MKVYRTDVTIFAALYVAAGSEEEARAKFSRKSGESIRAMGNRETFCEGNYAAKHLSEPKYSPSMWVADFKPSELEIELMNDAWL
jgi:hypothetical protein